MTKMARIGIDTSKSVFQLHGVDERDEVVLRKQVRRRSLLDFVGKLEPTVIGMEACGGSHHWAPSWRSWATRWFCCHRNT